MSSESQKNNDDSEDILDVSPPDDITTLMCPKFTTIKKGVFLFIIFILVSSDVFIDRVLSTPDNRYAEGRTCTLNGVFMQGVVLIIGYMLIDFLVDSDCI